MLRHFPECISHNAYLEFPPTFIVLKPKVRWPRWHHCDISNISFYVPFWPQYSKCSSSRTVRICSFALYALRGQKISTWMLFPDKLSTSAFTRFTLEMCTRQFDSRRPKRSRCHWISVVSQGSGSAGNTELCILLLLRLHCSLQDLTHRDNRWQPRKGRILTNKKNNSIPCDPKLRMELWSIP